MTKKNAILLLTFSILLAPCLAAADSTAAAPAVSQALSSLSCPAAGQGAATPAVPGTAITLSDGPNCCSNFERTCQRQCGGVVVEFTCYPESCAAFCVCG